MSIVEKPGYSAVVDLQLRIDGQEFSLAETGPDFCVFSQAVELPAATLLGTGLSDTEAEVIVVVDGHVHIREVQISSVHPDEHRRIFFKAMD